jgi:DNA-binding transcriptional MerR regulator
MEKALPSIPAKRYFTIGEVSDLCGVKPYVLRYWEQEFTQLKPMKRRGNRRYYQHHEVLLIRRIRDLLYEQGFTISGARNRLTEAGSNRGQTVSAMNGDAGEPAGDDALDLDDIIEELEAEAGADSAEAVDAAAVIPQPEVSTIALSIPQMRQELISIRGLLVI